MSREVNLSYKRWFNHLNPNIKKEKWNKKEDKIIIEAH